MRLSRDPRLAELEALYRERQGRFVTVARSITHDTELAADAVQEAFAAAVRSRRRFRGEGPLDAWVWRAVVNAALRQRAASRHQEVSPPVDAMNGRELPESSLLPLVARLPERQRLAIFLRYYADLDYRSIATALGVEVGTVSATLSQAHASLGRALEEVL